MPWAKTANGKPQWTPHVQGERVSAQSDANNPSITHIVGEKVSDKYDSKKDTRRAKAAGPGPDKYNDVLTMALIVLTTIMAWLLVNDIPHSDKDIEDLAMSEDETKTITKPLSRVIANSFIGSRYGEQIIGSEDYIALVFVSFMYCRRVWSAIQARFDRMTARKRSNQRANEPRNNGRNGTPQYQGAARPQQQEGIFINPAVSDT